MLPIEGDNEPNKVMSPFSLSKDLVKVVELAGEAFEKIVIQVYGELSEKSENEEEDPSIIITEDTTEYDWEKEYKENESKDKNIKELFSNGYNYYKILGLKGKFLNSKDEYFRKAYKLLALIYHPDKNRDNKSLPGVSESKIKEEVKEDREKEMEIKEKSQNEDDKINKENDKTKSWKREKNS